MDIETATEIVKGIDPNWYVSLNDSGTVLIDGGDFSVNQLEAIVYLLRNDPLVLQKCLPS